jgi:predicted Zn finger-like uncharacterized protein
MPNISVIACPECEKKIKVTQEVLGKKIRCKECGQVFVAKAPQSAPAKPAPAKPKAAPKQDDEDDDGKNPYALAKDEEVVPRCPHCVKELESKDDTVCLHCGYNLATRTRFETRTVYEPTSGEKFQWRLPGILCVVGIILLVTGSIILMANTKSMMEDTFLQDDETKKFMIKPGCFQLFNGSLTLFLCYHLGRFAYGRLVVNNRPPEQEIQKDEEGDEDDDD